MRISKSTGSAKNSTLTRYVSKGFIVTVEALIIAALFVWNKIEGINNGLWTTTGDGAREWMLTHHQHQAVTNNPASQPTPNTNQPTHDPG